MKTGSDCIARRTKIRSNQFNFQERKEERKKEKNGWMLQKLSLRKAELQ